jgi:hypothetical protein
MPSFVHRSFSGHVRRTPTVALEVRAPVVSGGIHVVLLERGSIDVMFVLGSPLFGAGLIMNAAGASAEGDAAVSGKIATIHAPAVHEGKAAMEADVHHSGVVGKVPAAPFAADKADAAVAEAVVHAAVVADVWSPIAPMEDVESVVPAPIGRRPQVAGLRRWNPGSGDPIIAVIAIGPVAGCPHQARLGARRLLIDRQRRRRKANADKNAGKRRSRQDREKKRGQKPAQRACHFHWKSLPIFRA